MVKRNTSTLFKASLTASNFDGWMMARISFIGECPRRLRHTGWCLRYQIGHDEANLRRCQRANRCRWYQLCQRCVTVTVDLRRVGDRGAANLQLAIDEVDDPVVGDAGTGVEAGLWPAVVGQRGVAHLDNQDGECRMVLIVFWTAGNDGYVRLGFRHRAEA